ncbi:MAG: glycerate kinase [Treponema sp.]|jgi:glycerate kinase|nr:glycerate kinase [Treponema sp.]
MKVVLVPDSFKGTMGSGEICEIVKARIMSRYPDAEVLAIPVADGGEGTVDAFLAAMHGEKVFVPVKGPYQETLEGFYGIVQDRHTKVAVGIIEMAACAGLPLVGCKLHPDQTTTFGVGQLIAHAMRRGCKKLILGLGGSATNDLGTGAAAALGIRFLDAAGNLFVPVGGTLSRIVSIDTSGLLPELKGLEKGAITAMCDIDNPLYGENGAAFVFAPQKGADPSLVTLLDEQLRAGSAAIQRELHRDVSMLPGAGAAGGMGGGMVAFLGASLKMGIETVLDTVAFETLLKGADLVISGEGRFDAQSLRGKVLIGVARRAKQAGVPVIALVGDIGSAGDRGDAVFALVEAATVQGVSAMFSINTVAVSFDEAKKRCREDLRLTADNIVKLMQCTSFGNGFTGLRA